MSTKLTISFILIFMVLLPGCTKENEQNMQEGEVDMAIILTSSAFTEGEMMPRKYSCDGENVSPPLAWTELPEGTHSLALIMDDPDAPAGTWVHWVIFNIPADETGLAEGSKGIGVEGKNTSGKIDYGGPCPPRGSAHRYFFKIYALETTLELKAGVTKGELERAMQGHILAQGQLMGKYQR